MEKFIIRSYNERQAIYLCHNNWSKSYSAGVLEFETIEAAKQYVYTYQPQLKRDFEVINTKTGRVDWHDATESN